MKTKEDDPVVPLQSEPVPELLEVSGSIEQYYKDMQDFVDRALIRNRPYEKNEGWQSAPGESFW